MKYLMGVDIGSTNIKALIFNESGEVISKGEYPTPYKNIEGDPPDWISYDPVEIWNCTAASIREALSGKRIQVESVAVTGIGMDAVPIDRQGEVLFPFISWRCFRTEPQYRRLIENNGRYELFRISGKQPLQYDTVCRVEWIKDNRPDIYEKAYKWLLIEDFINWKLCGVLATDYSMANCTSLFDTSTKTWSGTLMDYAGLDMDKFPEIKPSGTVLGAVDKKAARETSLPEGTCVVLGGHDYQCAAFACGGLENDTLVDSSGTFDCITTVSSRAITSAELFNAGMSCESHVISDLHVLQSSMHSGGILEWWKDNFSSLEINIAEEEGQPVWKVIMDSLESVETNMFFLPHLFGSESPVFDPYSRGAFVGMNCKTNRNEMLLAVMESLSYQMHLIVDSMESATGKSFNHIITVGGATRNEVWMQNKADILGKQIHVPEGKDEAAGLGAALLAGIGANVFVDEREAVSATRNEFKIYSPDKNRHLNYMKKYTTFKQLYPALKEVNARIVQENIK